MDKSKNKTKLSYLRARLLFVLWAIPAAWLLIVIDTPLGPSFLGLIRLGHLLIILITLAACFEYIKMLSLSFPENGFWLVCIWVAIDIALELFNKSLPGKFDFYLLLMIVAIESIIWGKKVKYERWKRASLLFSGIGFLYIGGVSLLNFYGPIFQSAFKSPSFFLWSQMGIITVVTSVFMCDTAAYFIGSLWGKHRFTSISPKKTIEGTVAGFFASVLLCSIGWYFFCDSGLYSKYLGIILGSIIGIFSIVGDLIVSLMKRYFGVKDSSNLIPGHGGVLDRFSSLFFTAPVVHLFLWLSGKLWS